ncbi:NADP-dependent oxidoreductase [Xanthocytophaga agilis]|uniref:NADP-dependent oxidoreductase n=1 Tax=Xanthocytophaga agilis TaxID=3048010 RepID=A0AAE3RDB8_9BACT|nr:NADP-dependent oxidoreductase [Xanthocytophaga agilis]MDJ1506547.1 NADP-dependent oxidoreductase [Xanthocytophaga agilis]
MKSIILNAHGGVDQLQLREVPIPVANADEVLIKVHAISINPTDIYARQNVALNYIFNGEEPRILGWDIAGEITGLGRGVENFKLGDRVFGLLNFPTHTKPGHAKGYAEYVIARVKDISLIPESVSYDEAAAAALAALTIWQPLKKVPIQKGNRVFITGAGGGVGHFAVQIAKHFGAYVITLASGSKRDFILSLGADEFIDYQTVDFLNALEPVDYVIEGLRDGHLARSLKVVKKGGNLLSLWSQIEGTSWQKQASDLGIHAFYNAVESSGKDLAEIAKLLEKGAVKPHISKRFHLNEIGKAHEAMETNHATGKIIVNPNY